MLDAGADLNATQSQRMTALMLAAKNGNVEVVRELSLRPEINLDLREGCIRKNCTSNSRLAFIILRTSVKIGRCFAVF